MAKDTGIAQQMAAAPAAVKVVSTVASLFRLVTFKRVAKATEYADSDGNKRRRVATALVRLGDTQVHVGSVSITQVTAPNGTVLGVQASLPTMKTGNFFAPIFTTDDPATQEQIDDFRINLAAKYVAWDEEQRKSGGTSAPQYAGKSLLVPIASRT